MVDSLEALTVADACIGSTNFPLTLEKRPLAAFIAIALMVVVVSAIYWPTVAHLIGLARFQEQATDAALVILVVLVLIWNSKEKLSNVAIKPCAWALIPLFTAGFVWLCGEFIFARVFTQFAVIAMLPAATLAVFGTQWARILAFPLTVLFFALPVWVIAVPTLVRMSAFVAEIAIRMSGVPIYRDGAYFILPSGSWSIADACSGVAFFSTSILLGLLYAWTIFESKKKRLLFVAGAAAIGVAGNWIRVYLTMMIAHLSDNRYLRDDHYMFGWYLFAAFLFGYFYFGWRHRESIPIEPGDPGNHPRSNVDGQRSLMVPNPKALIAVISACIPALVVWPFIHDRLADNVGVTTSQVGSVKPVAGWTEVAAEARDWRPELKNATFTREHVFQNDGRRVKLYLGVYQSESWDRKLVSVANQLAGGDGSKWSLASRGTVQAKIGGAEQTLRSGVIVGNGIRQLAWHWYWVDGTQTSGDLAAKFKQLQVRLRGREPMSVWITIACDADQASDDSARLLGKFVQDMSPSLSKALALEGNGLGHSN